MKILISALMITVGASAQTFTDVTSEMGINVTGLGSGAGWFDYDNDGDLDLFATNSSGTNRIYLYRNDGTAFTDVTSGAGLMGYEIRGGSFGDYDNDGWTDITAVSFGVPSRPYLFHNDGGTFSDVSEASGMLSGGLPWRTYFVDFDNDGWLDIYDLNSALRLYHNLQDGTFENVASDAGITTSGSCATWLDYNRDGYQDLYIGRDGSSNVLYENQGDGTFDDVSSDAGVGDNQSAEGLNTGDFNGDGWPDIYICNLNDWPADEHNVLYRNDGNGTFSDITYSAGVQDVSDGRTCVFVDYDRDGLVDIFSSNHVNPNRMYQNQGDETFVDRATEVNIDTPWDPFGVAWGDFNDDGAVDIWLSTHFGNELKRNDDCPNNYLTVELIGVQSNRRAIGAAAHANFDGRATDQWHYVSGGGGKNGFQSLALEFGLGGATAVDELEIRWPSGLIEAYFDIDANQHIYIMEGEGIAGPSSFNLLAPPDGSEVEEPVTLDWEDSTSDQGDVTYDAWYATDDDFDPYEDISGLTESAYTFPEGTLTPGETYYWKVRAWDGVMGRWCNQTYWSFTVHDPSTGIKVTSFSAKSTPEGIEVSWECWDTIAGFNLYRSTGSDSDMVIASRYKLNAELITGESPYEYLDVAVDKGVTYNYWLEAVDVGGASETFGPVGCTWLGVVPTMYALYQSRPNPTTGSATIAFDLPEDAKVTLTVYDISGRKIETAVDRTLPAGEHEAEVSGLAPGVYVYKLKAGEFNAARKMIVIE